MKYVFAILMMISPLVLPAQDNLKPLKVGDSVPDLALPALMNDPLPASTLYRYSGGLLILDFWATWCSSCLYSLPRLEDLRERYGGQLQVLMVNAATTGDDEGEIAAFLERRRKKDGSRYTLPVVVGDTVLSRLFRHKLLPHYAWIYKNKVVAVTGSEALTEENVETALRGDPLKVAVKQDAFDFDSKKLLFLDNNGGRGETLRCRSTLTGPLDGLPSSSGLIRDSAGGTVRLMITNTSILQLYRYAHGLHLPPSRIHLEVPGPQELQPDHKGYLPREYTYSYELILPLDQERHLHRWMRQDLERAFAYRGTLERRTVSCLVLREGVPGNGHQGKARTKNAGKVRGGEGTDLKWHASPQALAAYLSYQLPLPVLSEVHDSFSLTLPRPVYSDAAALSQALAAYGLELCPQEREVEVFVLRPAAEEPSP